MASYKRMAVDKDGNEILSISVESAIYSDTGVRLDNKLNEMNAKYTMSPVVVSSQSALDNVINNASTVDRQWYRLAVRVNVENLTLGGGVWYIEGFRHNSAYEWQDATIYYTGGSAKRTRTKMENVWTSWSYILTTRDLVQSDTVGGTDKVPSAEVTKSLGLEIDAINRNQETSTVVTPNVSSVIGGIVQYYKSNGVVCINVYDAQLKNPLTSGSLITLFTLPIGFRPILQTRSHLTWSDNKYSIVLVIDTDGAVKLYSRQNATIPSLTPDFMGSASFSVSTIV